MGVFLLGLYLSSVLINSAFTELSIPGENLDKQTLTSLGIKTIGWQGEEEAQGTNHTQVHVHHNYSKVSVQKHEDNYQQSASTFTNGQTQDFYQSQLQNLGQATIDESDYFGLTNGGLQQSQVNSGFEDQESQQHTLTGQQEYDDFDQNVFSQNHQNQENDGILSSSSHNNEQIYNAHSYDQMLNLDQIIQAENTLQSEQKFEDYPPSDFNKLQLVDQTGEGSEQKNFYTIPDSMYIHGFKYPPDPQDVYPINQQKPTSTPATPFVISKPYDPAPKPSPSDFNLYTKCPKMATGQFVYSLSCNQFLNCWKGRGFVQNCAPGTLFNPKTLECDFASKVNCITGPRKPEGIWNLSNQKVEVACPSGFSGVIPHYDDCSKFINCANGAEHVMDCPPGTLFSLKINNCDFPYKAECASWSVKFGNLTYGGGYSHQFTTSGGYQGQGNENNNAQNGYYPVYNNYDGKYVSTDDIRYHQGHNSNAGYNQNQLSNSNFYNNQGSSTSRPYYYGDGYHNYANEYGSSNNALYHQGYASNHQYNQNQSSNGNYYYNQRPLTSQPYHNSGGYHQGYDSSYNNQELGSNQHQIHYTQGQQLHNTNQQLSGHYQTQFVSENQNTNNQKQTSNTYGNKDEGGSGKYSSVKCPDRATGLFPHPSDCSKFLNCANGGTFVQDCGPGTVFNPTSKVCDFPYKVKCQTSANVQGSTDTHSHLTNTDTNQWQAGSGTGQTTGTQWQTSWDSQNSNFGKQNQPTGGQYNPHTSGAQQWQTGWNSQNSNSEKQTNQQTGGKYDSQTSGTHQWQTNWNSGQQNQETGGKYGSQTSNAHQWPTSQNSNFGQQNQYDGGWYGSGLHQQVANQNQGSSGSSLHLTHTGTQTAIKCPLQANGLYPHPTICSKYLHCSNGITMIRVCNLGNVFNRVSKICDFPSRVKCPTSITNQEHIDSHGYLTGSVASQWQASGNSQNSNFGNQNQQTGGSYNSQASGIYQETLNQKQDSSKTGSLSQSSSTSLSSPSGILHSSVTETEVVAKCPSGASGLYPHPTICSKFLNCANGRTFIQACGPGTVFNPTSLVCDFPYNVECGSNHGEGIINVRLPPPESAYDTSKTQTDSEHFSGHNINSLDKQDGDGKIQEGIYVHGKPSGTQGSYKPISSNQQDHYDQTAQNQGFYRPTSSNQQGNYGHTGHTISSTPPPQIIHNYQPVTPVSSGTPINQGHGQNTFNTQNQDWTNKNPGSYRPNTNVGQQQGISSSSSSSSSSWLVHNQNNFDQDTQESKNIAQGQVYGPNVNTLHPSVSVTDINADYEFGNEDVALEVGPVKPQPPKTLQNNGRERKDFCEPLDFRCAVDDCIPQSMVCDDVKDCPSGKDEEKCERYLNEFTSTSNSILAVRERDRYLNISLIYCAKNCLESKGFHCRSFSYRKDDGACFLSDTNVGMSGLLISSHPYSYYEAKAFTVNCTNLHKCPNDKCISYKKICDGVNDCMDRTDEKGCSAQALGYEIKLSGTDKKHEGRIEIRAFGKLGYVCDDKFGLRDADVVCRELGFPLGALEVKSNSYYAKDLSDEKILYLMDDVACLGNETTLRDCDFNGWGVSNCEAQEVVGVVCKTPLETCPKDHWKCNTTQECIPIGFVCDDVFDCADQSDESEKHCDQPIQIRLADGKSKYEGRVEIRYHGIWGTVCDDDFNDDSAKVVCKQLGYPGKATSKKDGYFGEGAGPIWLDQVFCQGNESGIQRCVHWNWGEHNCEHSEDVGVICANTFDTLEDFGSERNTKLDSRTNEALPEYLFPERCGYRRDDQFLENGDVHFRVVAGAAANRGDYPWQASLRIKNKSKPTHWCGAVVISPKFVLTAAHCLEGFSKGSYIVIAGDYHTDDDEGTEQEAYIDEFYIHEKFRNGQKMNNDIALVKLKGKGFTFTKDIQPICLPESDLIYEKGLNCTISGFGSIASGKSGYSHQMRAGWIPLQSKEVCSMPHVYGTQITDGMVCAGSLDEGIDACDGDSGGPLACLHNGLFTLYGLTSWGQHCGHANKPGVYVKVSYYRNWIDETIRKHP